jgi:hypothetical protein
MWEAEQACPALGFIGRRHPESGQDVDDRVVGARNVADYKARSNALSGQLGCASRMARSVSGKLKS